MAWAATPCDAALGLDWRTVSPGPRWMIGSVPAEVRFACGNEMFRALAGFYAPTTQAERVAKTLGSGHRARAGLDAAAAYLGLDASSAPIHTAEAVGKQAVESAKTRESQLVTSGPPSSATLPVDRNGTRVRCASLRRSRARRASTPNS